MHQNLLNAEVAFVAHRIAGEKREGYPGHESTHKGVPINIGMLLLHICLPSMAVLG